MDNEITLSVIKADVGGFVGHSSIHEELLEEADDRLLAAQRDDVIVDYHVTACGDDLELIMTHRRGEDDEEIHGLAWDTFEACTDVARRLKLYGAGQDLLEDAFSGNVKGMGPGVAEMSFEEREVEPVIIFMADKTSAGAWSGRATCSTIPASMRPAVSAASSPIRCGVTDRSNPIACRWTRWSIPPYLR